MRYLDGQSPSPQVPSPLSLDPWWVLPCHPSPTSGDLPRSRSHALPRTFPSSRRRSCSLPWALLERTSGVPTHPKFLLTYPSQPGECLTCVSPTAPTDTGDGNVVGDRTQSKGPSSRLYLKDTSTNTSPTRILSSHPHLSATSLDSFRH